MSSVGELRKELYELRSKGETTRLESRRELLNLRSELNPLTKNLKQQGASFHLSLYQHQLKQVFDVNQVPSPYVLKILAQLCHALHCHEIQLKQIHIMKRYNKKIIKELQKQIKLLTEENGQRELLLVEEREEKREDIAKLRKEYEPKMEELQDELANMRQKLGIYISPSPMASPVSLRAMMSSDFLLNCSSFSKLDGSQTPELLKKSLIWSSLKLADEKDAHERGESNKRLSGISLSQHLPRISFGSPFSSPQQRRKSSFVDSTHSSKWSLDSRSDHYREPSRTSIFSGFVNLVTGIHEDGDEFASETPPQAMKPKVRRNVFLNGRAASIRDLIHQNSKEDDTDPTNLALKNLSDEVFSM
jgi:hypothetical protein